MSAPINHRFPPEIWREVFQYLESRDDRSSMALMVRCSKFLYDLGCRFLYDKFIADPGEDRPIRPMAPFFRTVARTTQLARLVSVLDVSTKRGAVTPRQATDVVQDDVDLLGFIGGWIGASDPRLTRFTTNQPPGLTMLRMLPCLLPNLKVLNIYLGANPYVTPWGNSSSSNRLMSLTSVRLWRDEDFDPGNPFYFLKSLLKLAPNIQFLYVDNFYNAVVKQPLPKLTELHFTNSAFREDSMEKVLRQCVNLERLTYTAKKILAAALILPSMIRVMRPLLPLKQKLRYLHLDFTHDIALSYEMIPTLRGFEALETLKISPDKVCLPDRPIQLPPSAESNELVALLPPSLQVFHLSCVHGDAFPRLRNFAQIIWMYPDMKEVSIESMKNPHRWLDTYIAFTDEERDILSELFSKAGVKFTLTTASDPIVEDTGLIGQILR
ncbi:hypothetical protein F4779DRAFT_642345 [Xylariaceae sp. FL0662B]|nr:hypothetical protein F4779DRAFT_642345 [Xylariaceae sp. FL0662B]